MHGGVIMIMFNPYEHLKSKCKKNFDDFNHFQYLLLTLVSMFHWSGLPDTIKPEMLESVLISNGTAGVARFPDGGLYTGIGSYCGDYKNFLPTRYLITNAGIGEVEGVAGEQVAVCWNNAMRYPDTVLYQYSSILTEIDVSERCNVLFTRLLRIPRVSDSKEKTEIEECVKSMLNGNFTATTRKALQSELFASDNPENRFFDLSDVDKVDKLQYLNQYRDNIIKRWFQMYGQGMQSTAKLAQQTTDELHGNDGVSMIIPLDRLAQRKKFCAEMNRLFGTSVTVEFSDSYAESYEEMKETYSNGVKEKSPEEGGAGDE